MTGGVDEAGLFVVGLVVEFVVFADGDVCVVTAEVDAAGLAVVELVFGGEDSFAALVEVIVVLVVVGVVLVEDEVFVEEVSPEPTLFADPISDIEAALLS